MKARKKPYQEMTAKELAATTRAFDDPSYQPPAVDPPAALKARHDRILARAKRDRGPGRPRVGKGSKNVMIALEQGFLEQVDAYAKGRRMSRSALIAEALRRMLVSAA